jgi:hypothetical protein
MTRRPQPAATAARCSAAEPSEKQQKTTRSNAPRRLRDRGADVGDGDRRGPFRRKTVDAGRDRGKGHRPRAVRRRQFERAAIAGCEQAVLARRPAAPDRADRVDDESPLQPVAAGDLRLARGAAAEPAAFREQARPGGAMDRPVDAAAAEQRLVGGVDDRVEAERRDVGDDDLDRHGAQPAGVRTSMPASFRCDCNSPDWNISRTMSQPPMNSPFT